jgi:hypothetical protein
VKKAVVLWIIRPAGSYIIHRFTENLKEAVDKLWKGHAKLDVMGM